MIFTVEKRQAAFELILNAAQKNEKIISLVQVGSGAVGYTDEFSDLDFVVALDKDESLLEVMDYMHEIIFGQFEVLDFSQNVEHHLQCYRLTDLLEIDIGFGAYTRAAAHKPNFKVLFDSSNTVEKAMKDSRAWFGGGAIEKKYQEDLTYASIMAPSHLMHAACAIKRNQYFRASAEMEFLRGILIKLIGGRKKIDVELNRDIDKLPPEELKVLKATVICGFEKENLWLALLSLSDALYAEMKKVKVNIPKEKVLEFFEVCK